MFNFIRMFLARKAALRRLERVILSEFRADKMSADEWDSFVR